MKKIYALLKINLKIVTIYKLDRNFDKLKVQEYQQNIQIF